MLPSGSLNQAILSPVGGGPDSQFLILGEGKFLGRNFLSLEPFGDCFNVLDFPAQNGALQGSEVGNFGYADHVATDAHDQRELIEAYKLESQFSFIEGAGSGVVFCWNKSDHFSRSEHVSLPDEFLRL